MKKLLLLLIVVFLGFAGFAQLDLEYQKPAKEILDLVDSPLAPTVYFDDAGEWMVQLERSAFKTLQEVAAKEYRLAGLRINPNTNGSSRARFYNGIKLVNMGSGEEFLIKGLPKTLLIGDISWSPNDQFITFTNTKSNGIELWVVSLEKKEAKRITDPVLNDALGGRPYQWDANSKSLICKFVDPDRGAFSEKADLPKGPVVRENLGRKAPARTYQDLLKNKNDEANFEYFASSKLVRVYLGGKSEDLTDVKLIRSFSLSPDGNYFMLQTIQKPFSYLVPYYRFTYDIDILQQDGKFVHKVMTKPLVEEMPKGFDACETGPRGLYWRSDKAATLYWVEALDEGDPKNEVVYRDALFTGDGSFKIENGRQITKTINRYSNTIWGTDELAIVEDYWWKSRNNKVYKINPSAPDKEEKLLFDIFTEDYYSLPGDFQTEENEFGWNTLMMRDNKWLYLRGEGYTPEGNKPFIDMFHIKKEKTTRLFQAANTDYYERIVKILDIDKGEIITSKESKDENPNYYLRNITKRIAPQQITFFQHPYESIKGVEKKLIKYKREDGVDLTATLYIPAGYEKEKWGKMPMLMWAYPREYKNAKTAGQMKTSPHRFTRLYYGSPIYWVARDYLVLDRADFPIIGEGDQEPNDTFIEQLVANAKAAIDAVDSMGILDRGRVAVGGHSYGAFMTANLLSHSDLFAAGIARSGAYNRTLTPFGFQAEERTYWEAPDIYYNMSPFMHADKMKSHLLLIHGDSDNNSGTFPLQSERYYHALKGHGAMVRLVMLPHESHGYSARENVLHMLWEQDEWLEKYCKGKMTVD